MAYLLQHIRVISRNSNLAIKQVEETLSHFPGLEYSIVPVETHGDKHKELSLFDNYEPDFFTRELDRALLNGEGDIAVHSAKHLPYPMPKGLEVIALLKAIDSTDALVCCKKIALKRLKPGARIGASSLSRKNELLKLRNDIEIINIRGTIEERINLVDNGQLDGVVVATCALRSLKLGHRISEILPFKTHPLQGSIAVVARTDNKKAKILFGNIDIRKTYGRVSLVGFGPGDPELMTIKGYKILRQADVIYYDDLISKEFITRVKGEKIYVGKRKGRHSIDQAEINMLLYQSAIKGNHVVRLKGGDPMIFAHGGEEIGFLEQYLVKTEVIPGISAGIAASGLTKIPLTYRGISSSVTFITAHNIHNINIPESGTLVFYMSVSNIKSIAKILITRGWHPNTQAAIVFSVSNPDQEETILTLSEIVNSEPVYKTPSIIIIGDVVNLKTGSVQHMINPTILDAGTVPSIYQNHRSTSKIVKDIEPVDLSKVDFVPMSSPNWIDDFMNVYKN